MLLTYSESDNPASPHYADQTELFSHPRFPTAWFCPARVTGHAAAPRHGAWFPDECDHKEALRSLKRKISDAIFARLQADARQASRIRVGAFVLRDGIDLHVGELERVEHGEPA